MWTTWNCLDDPLHMAGRIMALRILGKASFLRLRDESGDFQAYLARDTLGVENYKLVKKLDVGDIIGSTRTAVQDPDRRTEPPGRPHSDTDQVPEAPPRKMARSVRCRNTIQAAVPRSDSQSRGQGSGADKIQHHSLSQKLPDDPELPGSRNPDDADHSGRRHCQTF